jgi:hypothetical protein
MLGFEIAINEIQLLISVVGIVGAGVSSYFGVKMALARIETRQNDHDKDIAKLDDRLTWIEREWLKRDRN